MDPDRTRRVETLCVAALEQEPGRRAHFLDEACGEDAELHRLAEWLLAEYERAGPFLDTPAWCRPDAERQASLAPGSRLGPYEVEAFAAAGGMGEVYKGRDTRLDRTVAIKVLPPDVRSDPERRARFEREAKTIAALNHPHICTLHDIGDHEGTTFLVMEHLVGQTLAERLQSGPLPVEQALATATEIADALSAAHRQGVIHRDLKPGNVMLTESGAKLLDFGLAKLTGHGEQPATSMLAAGPTRTATLTGQGVILGTLQYMAPEQLEGKEVGPATDLFAFGCVLYEMVSGRRPFAGDSAASLIAAILEREPEPIASQQPLTPPSLDRFVKKCLAKEPDARWQSAADAADELRRMSTASHPGTAPVAPAAGGTGRFRRPVTARLRRVPLRVSFGVVAVAALAAGLSFTLRPSQPASGIASLAVLPLEDLSGDPSQKVVVDGIHDELTAVLSSIGALQVKSRRATLRFAGKSATEAAHALGVAAVLDGSVRMSGDTLKVTLSLLDGGDERLLWTGSYQAVLGDVLKLESQLALEVARELRAVVSPAERERLSRARAIDPEAYRLYRKGNRLAAELTPAAFDDALACFREAIVREPAYAAPHVAIARTYLERGGWWGPKGRAKDRAEARRAVEKAIELDPSLAESHMVLGAIRARMEWDWKGADEAFRRGLSLGPVETISRVIYANYLTAMGRFEESIAFGRETIARDPFEPLAYNELSFAFWLAGRHAERGHMLERSLALDPDSHQTLTAAVIFYASSDREKAVGLLARLETRPHANAGWLAAMSASLGDRPRALKWLGEAGGGAIEVSPVDLSWAWAQLGDHARSLDCLEQALRERTPALWFIRHHPWWMPIRGEARYQSVVRLMGLQD